MCMDISWHEMDKVLVLMMKDNPVIRFSLDANVWEVLDGKYVPLEIKGWLKDTRQHGGQLDAGGLLERYKANVHNVQLLCSFFGERVLSLDRENANKVYNLLNIPHECGERRRAEISLAFRSVSLSDCYWVKWDVEEISWADVDLRSNSLNEVVAHVALHGSSLTLNGKRVLTPEISTMGVYAKCWKREKDGLWLYKNSSKGGIESKVEVCVSNLLEK